VRRLVRLLAGCILYGTVLAVGMWAGLVTSAVTKLDELEAKATKRDVAGVVLARDNHTILRSLRAPTSRTYLETEDLPPLLTHATVAAEDRRFFEHSGIDVRGLARAALVDLRARHAREGGSTITQQMVKNTYVGPKQTIARKTREALFAVALETRWPKERILTTYLNTAYFGNGIYGIVDASRGYFGVYPKALTPPQAALLAALLRSPEGNNPLTAPAQARAGRARVLTTMHELGTLTTAQWRAALEAPLVTRAGSAAAARARREIAPQFTDAVSNQLIQHFGVRRALGSGLRVRTTLDPRLQRAANAALSRVEALGLDAALVAVDVATGEIRAMANGGSTRHAAFNVALDGHRQPGSSFKPFMLTAAYEAGMTPDTPLRSAPYSHEYPGGIFTVKNDGGYSGMTTLERATWKSDNTVYARLQQRVGIDKAIDAARAAGIRSAIDDVPATVLGALPEGATPAEMANAYATFARHGERISMVQGGGARLLARVSGRSDTDNWRPAALKRQTIPRGIADLVTSTLQGVLRSGTGVGASFGQPAAGKTGTTEDYRDAWFVGYTPKLAVAVWVGHARAGIPMRTENNGGPVTGGSIPAAIWRSFMTEVAPAEPATFELQLPEYVTVTVDADDGLLASPWCANAEQREFVQGEEPTTESATCESKQRPVPDVTGRNADDARTLLEDDGFFVADDQEERLITDPAKDGTVVALDPPPGTNIDRDTPIRLIIGSSPF
jgi:penicillin-binding protein 1A